MNTSLLLYNNFSQFSAQLHRINELLLLFAGCILRNHNLFNKSKRFAIIIVKILRHSDYLFNETIKRIYGLSNHKINSFLIESIIFYVSTTQFHKLKF